MFEFKREVRYIVIKQADVEAGRKAGRITHNDQFQLNAVADLLTVFRAEQGKSPLECVVVEKDWPEYEPVWHMIEASVTGKPAPADDVDTKARDVAREVMSLMSERQIGGMAQLQAKVQCLIAKAISPAPAPDAQPVGEVVAWAGTQLDKGITRAVDFRFLRFDVQPGAKLYEHPAPAPEAKYWAVVSGYQTRLCFSDKDARQLVHDNGGLCIERLAVLSTEKLWAEPTRCPHCSQAIGRGHICTGIKAGER